MGYPLVSDHQKFIFILIPIPIVYSILKVRITKFATHFNDIVNWSKICSRKLFINNKFYRIKYLPFRKKKNSAFIVIARYYLILLLPLKQCGHEETAPGPYEIKQIS